jgi:hypothetical protein
MACGSPRFFPADTVEPSLAGWYTTQLDAANEPALAPTGNHDREVIRFTWLPSFHRAVVIRVTREGKSATLVGKRLAGGPYDPGGVLNRTEMHLSREQWKGLQSLVAAADSWNMPSREPEKISEDGEPIIGMDGAQWLLEMADADRYHVVERWWHEDYPAFEMGCICLIEWSRLPGEDFDAYFGPRRPTRRCSLSKPS